MNEFFAGLFTVEAAIAFGTLLLLEIVLGIDNVIFLTILTDKLPAKEKERARKLGLGLAAGTRVLLLLAISAIIALDEYKIALGLSAKDLILIFGGLFLIGKSTYEIHEKLDAHEKSEERLDKAKTTLTAVIVQVILVDVVFSLDSVITAVGITDILAVMIAAILLAVVIMIYFAGVISRFVKQHPTLKILALSLLILIGTLLVIEGWNPELAHEMHLKNYAYFAMAFALFVEVLNIRLRKTQKPVKLHNQPALVNGSIEKPTEPPAIERAA